jgi:ATP-binding cassette, subfamily B, bacterial CvaB/MchF/RaxB
MTAATTSTPLWRGLLDQLHFGLGRRTPQVLQTEAAECGLACLAMLLGHHGSTTDVATLRRRHGATPQGVTLADLAQTAAAEQLATRAVRVELHDLRHLALPCILHWGMGHFVVLAGWRGERALIHDPAHGARVVGPQELSEQFTGVAMEAWPDGGFVPRQDAQRVSLSQMVGRVTGLWTSVWRVMAMSLVLEALALASPLFMQWTVDHVIVARDADLLIVLAIGFALVLVLQQLFAMLRAWFVLRVGTQLQVQWRSNVFDHLLKLPLEYFARRHLGDVASRFNAVQRIQQVLTATFVETVLDGLMVVLALVLMLLYSPQLAALAALSVLLYIGVRMAWYRPLRDASAQKLVRAANEATHFLESLRGMRTIRLFTRRPERLAAWQSLMVADVNAGLQVSKLDILYRVARGTLSGGFALLLLFLGARLVLAGELSVGMLLAFMAYRGQFDSRATELIGKLIDLRMLGLDAQRLADIVLSPPEAPAAAAPMRTLASDRPLDIDIADLRFAYTRHGVRVLDGLTLHIPAGQALGIVGPSGCGKSTLVHVLLGVYAADEGQIRIQGEPLGAIGLQQWREQVGTVLQDDVLFMGSIADNISFFDPRPNTAWIERCAQLAAIHDDVLALPMGYQTLVGDMGAALSGGQKQRLLLARALYRKPKVLILDEATSHLDVNSEKVVSQALAELAITRIVVAHRPQTLALLDRVVELRQGRIVSDEPAAAYVQRVF